jgi:serine protease Do/serine protease DegQ
MAGAIAKFQRVLRLLMFVLVTALLHGQTLAAIPKNTAEGEAMPSLAPMLKKVTASVVNIATFTNVRRVNPLLEDPFFRRFFTVPENYGQPERRTQSAGSGVIIDAQNGYILTNHHVVEHSDEIEVTLLDGRRFPATLIGSDQQVDIALLKINADNLSAIAAVSSATLEVGDFVVAIGNPFGLGQTVTSGIVSALGRSGLGIYGFEDFIQTDASINPGNSGGALVNLRGELIGINSAIIAPAGGNVGIGFAIPSEIALNVKSQLVEYGEIRRGQLGLLFQDITPALAEAFGLKNDTGAVISRVTDSSPASVAGFRAGDIVLEVDARQVRNALDLRNRIGLTPIGKPLVVKVLRNGQPLMLTAIIGEQKIGRADGAQLSPLFSGVSLRDYVPPKSQVPQAILVESQGVGFAVNAGLRKDDLIVAANRQRVKSIEELRRVVANEKQIQLQIERGGRAFYLVLR